MSREATLILIGIVLALLCFFSGLPFTMLRWVLAALGVIVAIIGYTMHAHRAYTLAQQESSSVPAA